MPRRALKPSTDRILEAAEKIFAREGYNEVSLRQLMAAAHVSTTAFYARFESKEAVLAALTLGLFSDLHQAAPLVIDQVPDLETGIDRGVDLLCERFGPRKSLVRLILSEAGSSPAAVQARRQSYGLLAAFLAFRFTRIAERMHVPIIDPVALAWALVGALEIHVVRWAVWDEIDLSALRTALRSAARTILPRLETP